MTLEIISAHEVMFKGEADSVTLPGNSASSRFSETTPDYLGACGRESVLSHFRRVGEGFVDKGELRMSRTTWFPCVSIESSLMAYSKRMFYFASV